MFDAIARPFGWLLLQLYNIVGNYGLAVILFALIVKAILLPFQMKSKRSMLRSTRLNPRVKELEKKHEGNKQKYQEALSKLYKDEKVNPMSGCLWALIPFPILIALFSAIRQPLVAMMGISSEKVTEITEFLVKSNLYANENSGAYVEITITDIIHNNWDLVAARFPELSDKLANIDYSFLGLNLGQQPSYMVWNFDFSSAATLLPSLGLFLIPLISALFAFFSMKISTATQPVSNDQQNQSMKSMMLMSPVISLIFGFMMPAALGIYWIAQSVFNALQDFLLNRHYTKILDAEDEVRREKERLFEEELQRKREETERLRLEGKQAQNKNTSKKKLQAQERVREEERLAQERAAQRTNEEKPDSQVGTRRFARGRAYVSDRYENPESAEEATALAAAKSDEYAEEYIEYSDAETKEDEDEAPDDELDIDVETYEDEDTGNNENKNSI